MKKVDKRLYLMIAPGLLIFLSMSIFPLFFTIIASFYKWQGLGLRMIWNGFENYISIFNDERFANALINNLIWMAATLLIPLILGFILALILNQNIKGENFFKSVFYYPGVISFIIIGVIFNFVFNFRYGLLNTMLKSVHLGFLAQNWLGSETLALPSLIVVASWQYVGFYMVVFLAGIKNVPQELLDAADIDGASFFRKTINVIIPYLKPIITIVVALTLINSIKVFDIVYSMTKGGPEYSTEVVGLLMYAAAFSKSEWGLGSAYGTIIFIITSILGLIYVRQMTKGEENE